MLFVFLHVFVIWFDRAAVNFQEKSGTLNEQRRSLNASEMVNIFQTQLFDVFMQKSTGERFILSTMGGTMDVLLLHTYLS